MTWRHCFLLIACTAALFAPLAAHAETGPAGCKLLLDALNAKQLSRSYYERHCGTLGDPHPVNTVMPSANAEELIEAIATRAPSMVQNARRYGHPQKLAALLGYTSLDQKRSLLSALDWQFYDKLVDFLTVQSTDYYIEEALFSSAQRTGQKRYTTLFWVALRSGDPSFMRNVLGADLSPYKLENDPSQAGEFPCGANIYLCVLDVQRAGIQAKQDLLTTLNAFSIDLPSWTMPAAGQEFAGFELSAARHPAEEICRKAGAGDCEFPLALLGQGAVPLQQGAGQYVFSDYAGFDGVAGRHLMTGQAGSDIFAAWIPALSDQATQSRQVELISLRSSGGRIGQFRTQIGKKLEHYDRLNQTAFLIFDTIQSRYVLKIVESRFK